MALKRVLFGVSLLCMWFSPISAQVSISSPRIEGEVGMNVTFNCTTVSPGVGLNIALERSIAGGRFEVFNVANANGRLAQDSIGLSTFFTFGPLMSSDNGLAFRCQIAGVFSSVAMISVTFAVMINGVTPDDRTITLVENGEVFNLTLAVEGNPAPSYTWTRNGETVMNRSTLNVTVNSIFANVVRENMGFYEVVYDNTIGIARYNFTLDIQYQSEFPANAVVDSPETLCVERNGVFLCVARTGSRVTLLCNATGNPSPTVTITPVMAPRSDNNIVFPSVTMNNTGNYTCTASSSGFNDVVRRFELTVGGPPGSVSDLTTTIDLAAGTITFTWTYPDSLNEVPITGFIITITQDMGGADSITMELPPNQLSFTLPLSHFLNQIPYTASVTVRNLQGSSEPIFDPFTIPESSASNIGASQILSLLMIAVIVLLF